MTQTIQTLSWRYNRERGQIVKEPKYIIQLSKLAPVLS
jgi:hypothetical protein